MKKITLLLLSATLLSHADQTTPEPFIQYHNRMAVFNPSHLTYERIKPNALYAGVEGWIVPVFRKDNLSLLDTEFRMGYNFFYNGRDHLTPFAGVGFMLALSDHHHHNRRSPDIAYGTLGFLYTHEFNTIFNLGLNLKGLIGGPSSNKHFDWGSPITGLDVALPITFRFGHKRHWDYRIEPFNTYIHAPNASENYFGFRGTVAYRF
jgi:hypothetical protein